ncbi:amidohydrolase family protein [Rhodobacter sp. NTK016B]|uniref:amidohydrolase family protein n=1 Tax=Rhodobacter sp. NTK016B TaxID=2759676 RepID=UPI001A90A937|nr:amidohydrolase family protein [Rhodobacter sp. NTK016B]MBN8291844.1 amidohydrolase family protein [Rhodobacter sp. NTK016B]
MIPRNALNCRLPGVRVPRSLIAEPQRFGGLVDADCLTGDLLVERGRAVELVASEAPVQSMILPRFCDPHVHLDKCHTIDRLGTVGGDLAAAIEAQRHDKAHWTEADLRTRAARGLMELRNAGCGTVRSHVDWGDSLDPGAVPLAWEVLGDLTKDCGLVVQRSALCGISQMAEPGYAAACARRIARDGGVMGAFVFDQPDRDAGIRNMFREAGKLGIALDFHVDEGLAPGLDGLERIADAALHIGFEGPVLCGHACALANLPSHDVARIADKLARAGIAVVTLPQTNLYLQGRTAGTPDRRGLTRVHELRAAGVNVVLGADNVRDAFSPIGRHDPRHSLSLAVLAAHLDPPFGDHLPMITSQALSALGLAPVHVDGTALQDLVLFQASSTSELLSGAPMRPVTDVLEPIS